MPNDLRRIRVDAALEQRIHHYAVVEARSFDGAARRLIALGLDAVRAQAAHGPAAPAREDR